MSKSSTAVFRILVAARNLEESRRFYETMLDSTGRLVAPGRVYFDAGPVILGVLDYSGEEEKDIPIPTESIYFATSQLEELHRRAKALGKTASGLIHGDPLSPMGEIGVRPWGERSFYAVDPTGNSLCFVDSTTCFTGTPAQVEALTAAMGRS
jgi:hypothetical protein